QRAANAKGRVMESVWYYLNRYCLMWMVPLLGKGASTKISEDDIPSLEKEHHNEHLKQQWRK
ncbi:hypothetical protein PMAYCL1PPCAC_27679, partial [Pristionchus mayeri]